MLDQTPEATVGQVLADLNAALEAGDAAAVAALFEPEGYWRDLVAFTWNIKTMEGREAIQAMLEAQLGRIKPAGFAVTPGETAEDGGGFLQAWIDFETELGRGHGHVRLRDGKIWTLLTTLKEMKGHEERRKQTRPRVWSTEPIPAARRGRRREPRRWRPWAARSSPMW
jgi:putative flavoprotein involved in K+ transport